LNDFVARRTALVRQAMMQKQRGGMPRGQMLHAGHSTKSIVFVPIALDGAGEYPSFGADDTASSEFSVSASEYASTAREESPWRTLGKVLHIIILCGECTRALTFQKFVIGNCLGFALRQAGRSQARHKAKGHAWLS